MYFEIELVGNRIQEKYDLLIFKIKFWDQSTFNYSTYRTVYIPRIGEAKQQE